MSLSLPAVYSSASKQGNIQENWIIQLGFFNGDAQGSGDGGWDAVLQADGTANLLTADVNSSTTTIPVDDGTVFAANDFLKIESEIVKVASISSNDLTVVRTQMSTSAEAHEDDDAIYWNNFKPIALSDTFVDSVFYRGVITNLPSIRTSIDLANSTAKTGNISLSLANFQYQGDDFSAELFLGTRKYINREVRVYSQLNAESTLSNCLQIYNGRLINISHDDSTISLQLTEQIPWDFITIPQTKSTDRNIYFPVAYGDFTPNATARDYRANKTLRPMPVSEVKGTQIYSLISIDDVTSNAYPHYYDKTLDRFIPVPEDTSYNFDTDADSYNGGFAVQAHSELERRVTFKPVETTSSTGWTNPDNAFDSATADETTNYTNADFTQTDAGTSTKTIKFRMPQIEGKVTAASIEIAYTTTRIVSISSGTPTVTFTLTNKTWGANDIFFSVAITSAGTTSSSITTDTSAALLSNFDSNAEGWGDELEIEAKVSCAGLGSYSGQFQPRIYDVRIRATTEIDWDESTNKARQTANKVLNDINTLYTGGDGLDNSFTGGSGLADTGLEAHRDLLFRFAGFDDTDANIYNYDASLDIEASRITTAWNIRWWELESVELKKILQQIQYEFGFIFKWRHDGTGSYWFIKDSYSSGDETQTFTKSDIDNLKISNTPFSELTTKMEISYEKHPAENRYLSTQTSEDTTNNPRTIWNIQSKENIKEIKLDMNVNKPGNTNVGGNDPNDGFADYYMNIFGDIKKLISCDIVNPAMSYNLETGDIVQFSNTAGEMPVDPFGDNWADFYMITNLNRSPGKVNVTVREVG